MSAATVQVRRRDPAVIAARAHHVLDAVARTHRTWPRGGRPAMNECLVALDEAIAKADAVTVRRIGHTIKGGCGMAGARQAARLGALLEAESDELNNSAEICQQLKLAQENLERMLEVEFPR